MQRVLRLLAATAGFSAVAACHDSTAPKAAGPTIASVTPATGTVGTELAIRGTNFRAGASVSVGSVAATNVQLNGDTVVYARVPSGVTASTVYSVTVHNSDGTSATHAGAFTAVAPTLSYVNGATKPSGNTGSTVIIEGAAFGDIQGTSQVLFSNGSGGTVAAVIASPDDWTDAFIITSVPAGAATGDVKVQTATGVSSPLTFTITSNAPFSPSTITWTATTPMLVPLSGHDAQFATVQGTGGGAATNYVYVTGGADSTYAPRTNVSFAPIQASGALGAWTATTALPAAVAFHASVVATPFNSRVKGSGFIYVLGGATNAAGAPSNVIYRGTLNSDGSVASWASAGTLPTAVHSLGAVLFRGDIYIAGGAGASNAPVNTVYRARIDSLGVLSAWQAQANLPTARTYHGFVQFGGYLYALGGDTGTVTPNDSSVTGATKVSSVLYARLDLRSGNINAAGWIVNASSMTKTVEKHTVVAAGGSVLSSGGLYNGAATGSSEQSYAQINSDGTIGSFAGATGAHTIASAGGKNLFNHAALAYVDAAGVSHVLVLGGDDVNAPGKKRAEVYFY